MHWFEISIPVDRSQAIFTIRSDMTVCGTIAQNSSRRCSAIQVEILCINSTTPTIYSVRSFRVFQKYYFWMSLSFAFTLCYHAAQSESGCAWWSQKSWLTVTTLLWIFMYITAIVWPIFLAEGLILFNRSPWKPNKWWSNVM